MKTLFTLLSLLALTAAHGAETPADGLYLAAPGAPAPRVQSQDGTRLFLGEKQELKVENGQLDSNNNANTTFYLTIGFPYYRKPAPNTYVLVVAGTAYPQLNFGCGGQRSCTVTFSILQDSNARQVANYFGIPITYFHHPGHRLSTSFTPKKPSFAPGEDVTIILRIVNVGAEPVAFRRLNRCPADREWRYTFSAFKDGRSVPDIGNRQGPTPCSVSGPAKIVLGPEAAYEDTVSLGTWFGFKEPGIYNIRGSWPLQIEEPDIRTTTLIWVDYATAEFTITIE